MMNKKEVTYGYKCYWFCGSPYGCCKKLEGDQKEPR